MNEHLLRLIYGVGLVGAVFTVLCVVGVTLYGLLIASVYVGSAFDYLRKQRWWDYIVNAWLVVLSLGFVYLLGMGIRLEWL